MRFTNVSRTTGMKWALCLMAALMIPGIAFADVLHFYDGKLMRGKLKRVTGDIIEFKQDDIFGSTENLPRLRLSNRHDIIETLTGHKYYGEIFYVDKFKIELKASTGMVHVNRLRVKNIVMGTPMQQPDLPNTPGAFSTQPLGPTSYNSQYATPSYANTQAAVSVPAESSAPQLRGAAPDSDEDTDAIPAVDRAP